MNRYGKGIAAVLVGMTLASGPVWADRGGFRPMPPGSRGHAHIHGHGQHFWGALGVLVGASLLYGALQPRRVVYESQVVYAPPVYYAPPTVQTYIVTGDPVVAGAPQAVAQSLPPPLPPTGIHYNAEPGPGPSGAQWWYLCRNPAGYYPHIRECPAGWEKVPSVPPDLRQP